MSLAIDQYYLTVVRLTTHLYDDTRNVDPSVRRYGTGFFFMNDQKLFLITNRHVIINETEKYVPNVIRTRIHTNMHDLRQNDTFDIHLYNGITRLWREPDPKTIDIVAIPLVDRNYLSFFLFNS